MTYEYNIFTSIDERDMEVTVQRQLNDGWETKGNLVVTYSQKYGKIVYVQAMIKSVLDDIEKQRSES